MATLVIKNIGKIVSGDIDKPVLEGSVIVINENLIEAIGGEELLANIGDATVVDANGTTVTPGLWDTHVHVTTADGYGTRQKTVGFIESAKNGGVTTMISAGECHMPGRPKDASGTKALAIVGHKSFANAKPGGVKVEGGALILEKGLVEKDFEDLAAEGVWIVGEIGLGSVNNPTLAAPMVEWAHKNGFKVQMHTGGTSIPGSSTVTANDVINTKPDVVSHINGGPTSIPLHEVDRIMDETKFAMEIVQCGNPKTAKYVLDRAAEKGQLGRVIFGNDAPSGTGIIPLGIMRNISFAASMTDLAPEVCVAMATGNPAKVYDKLNRGVIAPGKEADLLIMDAPMGSVGKDAMGAFKAGDIPGLSYVIIDGKLNVKKSSNTPPATRKPC
jgi:enamidase